MLFLQLYFSYSRLFWLFPSCEAWRGCLSEHEVFWEHLFPFPPSKLKNRYMVRNSDSTKGFTVKNKSFLHTWPPDSSSLSQNPSFLLLIDCYTFQRCAVLIESFHKQMACAMHTVLDLVFFLLNSVYHKDASRSAHQEIPYSIERLLTFYLYTFIFQAISIVRSI